MAAQNGDVFGSPCDDEDGAAGGNDDDDDDDKGDHPVETSSRLDLLLRAVQIVVSNQKQEQSLPNLKSPEEWRLVADGALTEALSVAEDFIGDAEAVATVLREHKCATGSGGGRGGRGGGGRSSSDEGAAALLFDALESLLSSCLDDPGLSDAAASARLTRAAALMLHTTTGVLRQGSEGTLVPFSPRQANLLRSLGRAAASMASTLDKALSGSAVDEDVLGGGGGGGSGVNLSVLAGAESLCATRFDQLAAPVERIALIERLRMDVTERLQTNSRFAIEFRKVMSTCVGL